ncbi:LuxR C-terminal-related transcriptional regulator [Leifsonia aquatica]|uniref:LuxR C-terminal-related transcriptional regulator n=1 Tax=Leifsonia aquatica TaxID=144185 RepID=UPI0028B240D1|nr:LuxR C-terminal-related transcriptional regulator [Leifsonia aquatica]
MFHFQETARIIASHVAEGRSVRLVGGPGSGRSSTLRYAARLIEARGLEVLRTPDVSRPPQIPGFAAAALQLGSKEERRNPLDLAISSRRALLDSPGLILLIDNADLLDSVSLEILDSVSPPLASVRVVRTGDLRSKPIWPEVTIPMPELGFEEVAELLRDVLDGESPAASLTARILSKSGGNPELAIAIAESSLMSGLLRRDDGLWRLASRSLWNEHLVPLVRWRIRDLSPDDVRVLRSLALDGPAQYAGPSFDGHDENTSALIARGLLRVVDVTPTDRLVHVWPPLVADLFKYERSAAADNSPGSFHPASWAPTPSATARIFQLSADVDAAERFRQWQETPTTDAASKYIDRATGNAFDRANAEEVFAHTSHVNATRDQLFLFEFQRAQWLALEHGDLDAALDVMEEVARNDPAERTRARAGSLLLRAFLDSIPADFADQLADGRGHDLTGFTDNVLACLHLFSGDIEHARAALPDGVGRPGRWPGPGILAPLVTAYAGDLRGSYTEALAQRDRALLDKDRTSYIAASYVGVLSSMFSGRMAQADEVISSALGLAPVTMFARPIFGAILNLASTIARISRRDSPVVTAFSLDVANYAPYAGPLHATGSDLTPSVTMSGNDRGAFDRAVAAGVRLRRSRGFIAAAWTTAVSAACFDTGDEVVTQIEELSHTAPIALFANSARAVSAVRHRRVDDLIALVKGGGIGQDAQLVAQIVRAGQRRALVESHARVAEDLEPIALRLEDLSENPLAPVFATLDAGERLSPREREIALLAGSMTNAQIAARLNISVRTVEHHISNGLHKVGRQTRTELASSASEDEP